MTSTNRVLLSVAMTATILLTACGGGEPVADTVVQPGVELASSSPPEADDQATDSGAATTAADTPAADDGSGQSTGVTENPLASREVDLPAANGAAEQTTIRTDVLALTRAPGDTIRLEFAITNVGTANEFGISNRFGIGYAHFDVSGISLVDLVGGKRYLVLADSSGDCVCTELSASNVSIAPGDAMVFSAVFPAPPAGTGVLDVQIPVIGVIPDVAVA